MRTSICVNAEIPVDAIHELASRDLWWYCKIKAPNFYTDNCDYLREVCEAWQEFEHDDNELLIINMPPRHGKSRTAGLAVQWLLGQNPHYKIITASYNEKLSRVFSKSARNDIQERRAHADRIVYSDIFPNTKIAYGAGAVDLWRVEGSPTDNYLATAPGATVTGFGGDFIVIDDIIKNSYEANNQTIMQQHFEWFTDTMYSRLEGKRKLILIMTRWATKDLAGRVVSMYESQGRKYRVISKKACNGDSMLNPDILNREQYDLLIQTIGEDIVRANYDQEPIDLKGKLYEYFLTYKELPKFTYIKAICDTADTGSDYLCNVIYGETRDKKAFVLDVYYTKEGMETTERETARRLTEHKVNKFMPESNNGGLGFSRAVQRECVGMGNSTTVFEPYTQTRNKEARILSNASAVMKNIYLPEQWNKMWPQFYKDMTEYQREGKNLHDDAPDAMTAIAELLTDNSREWTFIGR